MPLPDYQKKLLLDLTVIAIAQIGIFYGIKYALNRFDPQRQKKDEAKQKSRRIIDKLGLDALNMNEYEQVIAGEILWPEDIKVTFDDIGGLESTLSNLKESVIYPLMYPEIFESVSGLLGPPKGVLLYGPPGI